jgi:hypothetical protein
MNVLEELQQNFETMNVNFLSNEIDNYSITKMPTKSIVETSITGERIMKDVYQFSGKFTYGSEVAENLNNIGFWEEFEEKIYSNNEKGVLPDISNVIEIKCLNCGSMRVANSQDCEMTIQIQIDYKK